MRMTVLNCAVNGWYPSGQDRLVQSLAQMGYQGETLLWKNIYPPNCPKHDAAPYAFKPFAFKQAMTQGYDVAFWLDASMWAVKSLDPIIAHIEQHGVAVWRAGWTVGEWSTDRALAKMGLTRDMGMGISLVCGGIVGLDLRRPLVRQLVEDWVGFASDGVSFQGEHSNKGPHKGSCSADERCLGHRHDMPSLSMLVARDGHVPIDPPKWFAYSTDSEPAHLEAIILARGM